MPRSRVFILYSHSLFARGVRSLLDTEEEVEVVGMEREDRQVLDRIRLLRPDVVLVDSSAQQQDACLTISEIFREIPGARVISLTLQGNGIDIYDNQRITASGPKDLVRAIRGAEPGLRTQDSGLRTE